MPAPVCEICRKGPANGVTVYRASPKGQLPAVWRCASHPCAESLANQTDPVISSIEQAVNPKPVH